MENMKSVIKQIYDDCPDEFKNEVLEWKNRDEVEQTAINILNRELLDEEYVMFLEVCFKLVGIDEHSYLKVEKVRNSDDDIDIVVDNNPEIEHNDDGKRFEDVSKRKHMDIKSLQDYYSQNIQYYYDNFLQKIMENFQQSKSIYMDVAELCFDLIKEYFVMSVHYDNETSKESYELYYCNHDNVWVMESDACLNLMHFITKNLSALTNSFQVYLKSKKADQLETNINNHLKKINEIIHGSADVKRKVIENVKTIPQFRVYDFQELLDTKRHYFLFQNGVYNSKTKKFRKVEQIDLLSGRVSIKYNYLEINEIEDYDHKFKFLDKIYRQILGNHKDTMLEIEAKTMCELNTLNNVFFHIGTGGNGKSMIKEFQNDIFGGYIATLDANFFNAKATGSSSQATPELMPLIGAYKVCIDEGNRRTPLDTSKFKKMSGGDRIQVRGLYKASRYLRTDYFTIHFYTNDMLQIDRKQLNDDAIERRTTCLPYKSKFKREKPTHLAEDEEYYPLDNKLGLKLKMCKMVGFHYIMSYYDINKDIVIPSELKEYSSKCLRGGDELYDFLKCYVIQGKYDPKNDSFDYLHLKQIKDDFKRIMSIENVSNIKVEDVSSILQSLKFSYKCCENNKPESYVHDIEAYQNGDKSKRVYANSRDIFKGVKYNSEFFEEKKKTQIILN